MSAIAVLLVVVVVGYVASPLIRRDAKEEPPPKSIEPEGLEVDGVVYESEAEWALERLLGRAGAGVPAARASRSELEAEIEAWVAAVSDERRRARVSRRVTCQVCGKPFRPGDNYCARCGHPHPGICAHCGARYRPGDRFCTQCGAAIAGGQRP